MLPGGYFLLGIEPALMVRLSVPNLTIMAKGNVFYRVFNFYREGFRGMTIGKTLWGLILLKLFIMFVILRIFFFQPHMRGMDAEERSDYVTRQLTETPNNNINP